MQRLKTALWGSKNLIVILAGQYYDGESGLHYNYHRYHDPATGRYLRTDPLRFKGDPNLYSYAKNNPSVNIDPTGEIVPIVINPWTIGGAILIGGAIWYYLNSDPPDIAWPDTDDNFDDDFCYARWEKEDTDCQKWSCYKDWGYVSACKQRASNRRDLCYKNGGRPDPNEPDVWSEDDMW